MYVKRKNLLLFGPQNKNIRCWIKCNFLQNATEHGNCRNSIVNSNRSSILTRLCYHIRYHYHSLRLQSKWATHKKCTWARWISPIIEASQRCVRVCVLCSMEYSIIVLAYAVSNLFCQLCVVFFLSIKLMTYWIVIDSHTDCLNKNGKRNNTI